MWFPWRSRKSGEDSEKALKQAEENLFQVQKRGEEVRAISEALREIRERNHFAEQLEEIIVRRRGSFR